jgi:cytochrome bd ubiquinol oxidase subunit II
VLIAVGLAAIIVLPGFILLYVLDQRGLLPEEGVDDAGDRPLDRSPVDHARRSTDR